MANATHSKQQPFSAYVYNFDELLKKLQQASASADISQLVHEINQVLANYFKAMMSVCEEQHQQLFDLAEKNRDKYSEKAKKAFEQAQTDIASYIQQAREVNQAYWEKAKAPLKFDPQNFIRDTLNEFQKNLATQISHWQQVGQSHSKEWVAELESLQGQASELLAMAEHNHQTLLAEYRELENRLMVSAAPSGYLRCIDD